MFETIERGSEFYLVFFTFMLKIIILEGFRAPRALNMIQLMTNQVIDCLHFIIFFYLGLMCSLISQ